MLDMIFMQLRDLICPVLVLNVFGLKQLQILVKFLSVVYTDLLMQTTLSYWQLLEQNIDEEFNQKCYNILVTGDFNMDFLVNPNNKMSRLISSYNAQQLIQSPTHFTERSHSLIDLIFIKHHSQVISSCVPFVPDLIRFFVRLFVS